MKHLNFIKICGKFKAFVFLKKQTRRQKLPYRVPNALNAKFSLEWDGSQTETKNDIFDPINFTDSHGKNLRNAIILVPIELCEIYAQKTSKMQA